MHSIASINRRRDLAMASAAVLAIGAYQPVAHADESPKQLDDTARTALHMLYKTNPVARICRGPPRKFWFFPGSSRLGWSSAAPLAKGFFTRTTLSMAITTP